MFSKIVAQVADFYNALTSAKKAALIGLSFVIVLAFATLFIMGTRQTYQPLMTNLNTEDSAAVMRFLREKNIPFKVDQGGGLISVPPDKVYDLRLELSTIGLPETSVVGYEVFDKQSFGVTSAVQKINEKRAIEGELVRTINTISMVEKARVHLNLPNKSVFLEEQKKPSASVVLQVRKGMILDKRQILGVQHLVAKSVEGMTPDDVVVLDSTGKKLTQNPLNDSSAMTNEVLEYKDKIERDYERRVEELLAKVVGDGRVIVKVAADVNFEKITETSVSYDANNAAVVQQNTYDDNMTGSRPAPGGLAGAASQLPDNMQAASPAGINQEISKKRGFVTYKVPETQRQVTRPMGGIRRLSVAVLVNGRPVEKKDENGVVSTVIESWSAQELKQFESLVANAIGLQLGGSDDGRTDTLKVENMSFYTEDVAEAERLIAAADRKKFLAMAIQYAVIGLIVSLFFLMVVRPFIRWVTENTTENIADFLPKTIAELEGVQDDSALAELETGLPSFDKVDPLKAENEYLIKRINEIVSQNPEKAAQIIHEWINDKHGDKKTKKGGDKEAEAS